MKFDSLLTDISENGRSPYGERGLKLNLEGETELVNGRSPYGERGLKLLIRQPCSHVTTSLPLRGAWIEIYD